MDVVAFILCVIFTLIVDEFSYYPIGWINSDTSVQGIT